MTLLDILTGPWAITPDKLLELQAIYATHLRGDKIDLEAIEARLGRPLANEQRSYQMVEGTGVAVLEISGVISPKANMFTRISGGAAASLLQQQVQSMAADPRVKAVVIDADSPGGNVLGIPALADAIRALAAEKPTVTVCTGLMCSAMYWVGSAANAVYLSGTTDFVGSIGVVATHSYDPRKSAVQTTEITAGKYKRIASDSAPLDAEGRAYMQSQVDQMYSVFVDAVAANRRVSAEDVLTHMADGRVFIGQQAIDAGLADGFATVDQMVERLAADPSAFATRHTARLPAPGRTRKPSAAGAAAASATPATPAAPAALSASPSAGPVCPPAAAANNAASQRTTTTMPTPQEALAAFAAENPEAAALARADGAAAERARIQAVREQRLPGHDALIEQLAFDGKTTGPEAAAAVIAAERTRTQSAASARQSEAVKPVPAHPAAAETAAAPAAAPRHGAEGLRVNAAQADLHVRALAYQAAHPGTQYLAAVKAVQVAAPTTETAGA